MPHRPHLLSLAGLLLFTLLTPLRVSAALGDPSGRVARMSHFQGQVSYSPAGEDQWFEASRNRPLIRGDRLWTDREAQAELQVGSAAVRLGPDTSVEILDLTDRIAQFRLTQGTVNLSVRRLYEGQTYEVATPTFAFTIDQPGRYRVDVDPDNDRTTVMVWEGAGEAYGEDANFPLRAGDAVRFYGADLHDYEIFALPREDSFDRYALARDQDLDRAESLRYVDDDVVGYADLDEYGSWRSVGSHGDVWFPNRVDDDWAPYRDGQWVWQDPWGWTWVDNAPWGFAPSHYGRWVSVSNHWGWIPGPRNVRPIYAPALVAFVGGRNWGVSLSLGGGSPIGWFPLGPREVYVPSYAASRDYFTQVNVNNTVINHSTITNVYNNYAGGDINVAQVNYANREIAGALTAVPSAVFVNAQPVRPAALHVDRDVARQGELTRVAPIAPNALSVIGAAPVATARPSRAAFDRKVVARNSPPPRERPFAERKAQLEKQPGHASPRAVGSDRKREERVNETVRVIAQQPDTIDARASGSRRGEGKSAAPVTRPESPIPATADRKGRESNKRNQADRRDDAVDASQTERRQRKMESDQQAVEQQRGERERQAESQQPEQRQRKMGSDQQAVEQQHGERERQAESQQPEQRQRNMESDRQAVEQQRGERERQAESQQPEERQRNMESDRQAVEQQRGERERQAESQGQVPGQRNLERESQAAAEQRRGEGRRQAEPQQQGRQHKLERDRQAAERPLGEGRETPLEQQEQHQPKAVRDQQRAAQRSDTGSLETKIRPPDNAKLPPDTLPPEHLDADLDGAQKRQRKIDPNNLYGR